MFEESCIATDEDVETEGAGITYADIGRAIMIWRSMQEQPQSVGHAALVFNCSPDVIRAAVAADTWAFLTPQDEMDTAKQFIDVDGE
jgi:hypothetical protein